MEVTKDGRSGTTVPKLINSTQPQANDNHFLTIIMLCNDEFLQFVIEPPLIPQL